MAEPHGQGVGMLKVMVGILNLIRRATDDQGQVDGLGAAELVLVHRATVRGKWRRTLSGRRARSTRSLQASPHPALRALYLSLRPKPFTQR